MNHHARGAELGKRLWQEGIGDRVVHKQGLARIAHAYALGLGVHDDRASLGKIGALMNVDVTVARARLDNRHQALTNTALDEAGTTARNQNIHHSAQRHERPRCSAIGHLDDGNRRPVESARLYGIRKMRAIATQLF